MKDKNQKNCCNRFWEKYQCLILGYFGDLFTNISKSRIFFKNPVLPLFYLHSPLTSCKKSEKSLQLFLGKQHYEPTNQPIITNNTNFIGPHWRRSKKIIKSKRQWEKSLKFQYRFKVNNTQLKRRQSTRHYYGLEIQCYYQNLQKIDVFTNLWLRFSLSKLAYYLSSRVIFSNLSKSHSQCRIQTTKYDMETEKYTIESFSKRM